jgi:cytochrome c2
MPPAKVEPGRDSEMARRTQTLNVVFALTSIGLLLAFSLMVWEDYNREWKKYQTEFNQLEVNLTEAQIQQALSKEDAARRQALQEQLARGRQEEAARAQDIRAAEREKGELDAEWYRVDQNFRFTKADIDVARYEYEEAVHQKSARADRKKKHLDDLENRWSQLRLQLQDIESRRQGVQTRLDELEKTRLAAEKEQTELAAQRTRLEARLRTIKPGFVSFVRNLPVLDLANPSLKINQIMPANLKDDVIFTATEKVDRCTTCHLGIDKKGYEDKPQPFKTHPNFELYLQGAHPIEKVGCTACHQGRGRATSFVNAAHTPSTTDQEKAWARYSGGGDTYHGLHYWDLPMMARGHTEAQCVKCHQAVVEVPKADRLNTGLQLIERYGCYGCHKIKGWEGLRKVGPTLTKITGKTTEDWIFNWIKEPRKFRPTRMPQVWDVRPDETKEQLDRNNVEANAVVAYLAANAQPETYSAPPAGDAQAGRKTFEAVGCLGCHRVGTDRRGVETFDNASYRAHGPNLDGTGTKVNPAWLYSWLKSPRTYWHDTRMPNLRLSDKEAADLVAYLMSLRNDAFIRERSPIEPGIRDAIVREHLIAANVPVKQADEQLAAMDDRKRTLFVGEKTIGRYGCFGCHEIKGFEKATPIGAELTEQGSKLVDRLDFAYEHGQIPHTLPGWLKRKVEEPRIFDKGKVKRPEEMLRMPKFWVSGDEADTIVTGLMSFTKEQVPLIAQRQLGADDRYVQAGQRLVREYNCRGCHQVGDHGGAIREVVKSQLEAAGGDPSNALGLSPPLLYNANSKIGEGARVHTEWLHDFLADPSRTVRPWFELRMPTFEFSEEQLNTLTRYFAAQDRVPYPVTPTQRIDPAMVAHGRDLFEKWQCVKCHVVAGKLPNQEPANMAPDLANVPSRLRPDWLTVWLADPQKVQPGTRMPTVFPTNPQENAFPEILGGDQAQQIEAMRAYLLTLGGGQATRTTGARAAGSTGR